MKKSMVFLLVLMFTLTAVWSQGAIQKRPSKMVMKKTHLRITYPTQNYVYYIPGEVKIKVKLVRPAKVLFHVYDLSHGGVKKKMLEETNLRKARDGSYRGAITFVLRTGRHHVIAAPQTNLGKDSEPAGPIKFVVKSRIKPVPIFKKQ